MSKIGAYIFVIFIAVTVCYSLLKKRNVFQDFTGGVPSGLKTGLAIFPAVTAMTLAVNMFTKSGLCDYLTKLITPVFTNIGIPAELIPLITITPLSGSSSLSIFGHLLKNYGCDSFIGRCASAVMSSTETTFYVITVYFGAIGIKKIRHTAFASLCANIVSVIIATLMVKLITFQ